MQLLFYKNEMTIVHRKGDLVNIIIYDIKECVEIDGLKIYKDDLITVDLNSENKDIVLGFIYNMLKDVDSLKILRNDGDIIQFQILDMDGTVYSVRSFYHVEDYYKRVQELLLQLQVK